LAKIVTAALGGVAVASFAVAPMAPVPGLLLHGSIVVVVFFGVLAWSRFFVPNEIARLTAALRRVRRRTVIEQPVESAELGGEVVAAPTSDDAEVMEEMPEVGARSTATR